MTFNPEISTINQRVQIGPESTIGTPVAASKLLECFNWKFDINADVSMFGSTGHKYDEAQAENWEQSSIDVSGNMDFNGVIYLLGSVMGAVSPTSHGASSTAKDWVFIPPVTGSIAPQTYTIQQGDSTRARSFSYGLLNSFGYKGTRKTPFVVSSKGFGQALSDGITLTSNPTAVALSPLIGKFFNVYLDTASGSIGTTQLTRCFSVDFSFDNVYDPFYPLNRANASYTGHIDLKPKCSLKLLLEADATGLATMQTGYLQTGSTVYVRCLAQGKVIDNLQTVSLGSPSGGTFSLTYKGQTASGIAYNASAAAVQTAITGLSTVGAGNATVSGSNGGPYSVIFTGTLSQDTTAMTGSGGGLTGGTFTITQNQSYNIFQHDMACKVGKPSEFKDAQGIYAVEWELNIVEDPSWSSGQAQVVTVTNLITAL